MPASGLGGKNNPFLQLTAPATPAGQQLTAIANSYAVAGNTAATYLNVIINNAITWLQKFLHSRRNLLFRRLN